MAAERVMGQMRAKRANAERQYFDLLRQLAAGVDVSPVRVDRALRSVGRTVGDLERDLVFARKRAGWRAALRAVPELEKRAADLMSELEAARQRVAALESAVDTARRELGDARAARDRLLSEPVPGCPAYAAWSAASETVDRLRGEVTGLRARRDSLLRGAQADRAEAEMSRCSGQWLTAAVRRERQAEAIAAGLAAAEQELAAAETVLEKLTAQLLDA